MTWRSAGRFELLQNDLLLLVETFENLRLHAVRDAQLHAEFFLAVVGFGVGDLNGALSLFVVNQRGFRDHQNVFLLFEEDFSIGAHVGFQLAPGFEIDTRTSKVVTLSFSLPRGEILVTLPVNFLSLNDSTTMRAVWLRKTLPMSASSTLPCTYTSLTSPSVMIKVACEPSTRMELTASPTFTSRESTRPSIGVTIVELRRSSCAFSSEALACATCASVLAISARETARLRCALTCLFKAI